MEYRCICRVTSAETSQCGNAKGLRKRAPRVAPDILKRLITLLSTAWTVF